MDYIQNFKKYLLKYISFLLIAIILTLTINILIFQKDKEKYIYEIAITRDLPYVDDKEGLFLRTLKKIEQNYANENDIKYKTCIEKYSTETTSLARTNLILSCMDENIMFIEFASRVSYIIINLKKYNETFDKKIKLSMEGVISDTTKETQELIKTIEIFKPFLIKQGKIDKYLEFQTLSKTYQHRQDHLFDIVNFTYTEKLSYTIVNFAILVIINIVIYFILILLLTFIKNKNV